MSLKHTDGLIRIVFVGAVLMRVNHSHIRLIAVV